MAIATYAGKTFEVSSNKIYTFKDFQYNSALQIEKQDAAGKKPSTYNKGPDLDSFSLAINLSAERGVNPRNEWGEWKAICARGAAYQFVMGGIPLGDAKWLLIDVSPYNFVIDNEGGIWELELSLEFQEYVRAGSAEASSSNASTGTTINIAPGLLDGDEEESIVETSSEEKYYLKRNNPNIPLIPAKTAQETTENFVSEMLNGIILSTG